LSTASAEQGNAEAMQSGGKATRASVVPVEASTNEEPCLGWGERMALVLTHDPGRPHLLSNGLSQLASVTLIHTSILSASGCFQPSASTTRREIP
jgi:hypothetical protein